MKRLAGACLLLLATACPAAKAGACTPHGFTSQGEKLPACSFSTIDGGKLTLPADIQGEPTILNFWASWCVSCIKEMPAFQRVASAAGDRVRVLGMNTVGVDGETEIGGRAFAQKLKITYPIAFDEDGLLFFHFSRGRATLPITVYVDATGTVADFHIGELTEDDIKAGIKTAFGFDL